MASRIIQFLILFACIDAFAATHGERQLSHHGSFPACERRLWNPHYVHDPLNGEPNDPHDAYGFVSDRLPLTLETLVRAYANGIYVAGEKDGRADLYTPAERGVMLLHPNDLDRYIPRRDLRMMRNMRARGYRVKFDTDFEGVIRGCRNQKRERAIDREWRKMKTAAGPSEPWISDRLINVFLEMHVLGYAHSVEVYYENELVAGLYGTFVEGVFTGESMFFKPGVGDNATKLALDALRRRLALKGHLFIDTEDSLGLIQDWNSPNPRVRKPPRATYQNLLRKQQALELQF